MNRIEHDYGVDFIPFAEPDEAPEVLAGRGCIQIFDPRFASQMDKDSRPWDAKIANRVKFDITLRVLTRLEWEQFKCCVEMAFDELEDMQKERKEQSE